MVRSWCRRTAVLFVLVSLSAGLAPYALGQQASDQETSDQPAAMQESAEQEGAEEVAKEQQAAKEKAAEKAAIVSANPLRPANTASPRDTLESFITSVNEAVQRWRANEPADAIRPAFKRFEGTLDLSAIPRSEVDKEAVLRGLMLKEILDRIDLPPLKDVPGKEEIEQTDTKHWTIPDTKITIAQVEGVRVPASSCSRRTPSINSTSSMTSPRTFPSNGM